MQFTCPFVILLGGPLKLTPRLEAQIAGARAIAADGGIRHAETLGVVPELWAGDFDSTGARLAGHFADVPRAVYPAEKDMTDGEIAIEAAIERGADRLILAGALGGARSDHALLHFTQGLALAGRGLSVLLTSGDEEALPLLPGIHWPEIPEGALFSIIMFSPLSNLSIAGARYPLEKTDIPFASSRTLSNEATGRLRIEFASGMAMLMTRPTEKPGDDHGPAGPET